MLRGALIGLLLALVLPASAAAAPQTWVSGIGNDANPCTRTAPCKTFPGAYSKTDVGGEVTALDSGGYGTLVIGHSITINGNGNDASVLASGTNGFTVSAGATDRVVIKGIHFIGIGSGFNAIRITSAGSVEVQDSNLYGFVDSGVDDESTDGTKVDVANTTIHDNTGDGVLLAPAAGSPGFISLERDTIDGNGCGVVATDFGVPGSPAFGNNCGVNTSGATPSGVATISASNSAIMGNTGAGVFANGSPSIDYIQKDTITNNGAGLQELAGGQIVWVGENWVYGNTTDGAPTSTVSGPPGPQGAPGARGAAGKVELVTCKTVIKKVKRHGKKKKKKVQKCTAKLVSGVVKVNVAGRAATATLSRGGNVYAVGVMSLGGGGSKAALSPLGRVRAGRYRLTLERNGRVVGERTVVVGR